MRHYTLYIYRIALTCLLLAAGTGSGVGQTDQRPSAEKLKELIEGYRKINPAVPADATTKYTTENWYIAKNKNEGSYTVMDIYWPKDYDGIKSQWPNIVSQYEETNIKLQSNSNVLSSSTQILYAIPGEVKTIRFQKSDGGTDNIDGFVHWYVADKDGNAINDQSMIDWRLNDYNQEEAHKFSNGLAWLRGKSKLELKLCLKYTRRSGFEPFDDNYTYSSYQSDQKSKSYADGVTFEIPQNATEGTTYYLYCDASGRNDVTENGSSITTPPISIRKIYEIRVIKESRFNNLIINDAFDNQGNIEVEALTNPGNYFLEHYEIYTPLEIGTNYRLSEPLENYVVTSVWGNNVATPDQIRWRAYDDGGKLLSDQPSGTGEIIRYTFPKTEAGIYYLTAEVSKSQTWGNPTWFPVSLLKIHLENDLGHLTKDQLESATNSADRNESELLSGGRYEKIADIRFQTDNDVIEGSVINTLISDKSQNVRNNLTGLDLEQTNYSFADPQNYDKRTDKRASVGRGEFALYRTLNYEDISRVGTYINSNNATGYYNDYFGRGTDRNSALVDRTWEESNGTKSGYFFYVDAADEPGIITDIPIEVLCSNTSLIVTAWVCNASASDSQNDTEIGITFKQKNIKTNEEVIIAKYYSGTIASKTSETNILPWQQLFFKFSFSENFVLDENNKYFIEIANNSDGSSGADFAIDDIQVYRSLPDIDVQRKNACESSTLEISSDYETIRRNMGWDLNADVLSSVNEEILNGIHYRKFRYGLMGPTLETDLNKVPSYLRYLGNIYYGFVKELVQDASKPDAWITLSKQIAGLAVEAVARSKSLRVVVPTDMQKFENIGTEEGVKVELPTTLGDALKTEYKLNIRAIRDFVQDVELGKWKDATDEYKVDENSELYKKLNEALYINNLWNSDDSSNGQEDGKNIGAANVDAIMKDPNGLGRLYEESVVRLFAFLKIPRIRCPWHVGDKMYLDAIDVDNTDLHFAGEKYTDESGNQYTSDGKYHVVMFNAENIMASADPSQTVVMNLKDPCTLTSEFYVIPSVTIAVDTDVQTSGITCVGSIHTLNADLMVANVDEVGNIVPDENNNVMVPFNNKYKDATYTFDWFLGSMDEYNKQSANSRDLQTILKKLRDYIKVNNGDNTKAITVTDVNNSNLTVDEKSLLSSLLGDNTTEPRLISGTEVSFRWVKNVVAIPYVPTIQGDDTSVEKIFCTKPQAIELAEESNVPEAYLGYNDITGYPDTDQKPFNAPLRLGMQNISDNAEIKDIPIRSEKIKFGVTEGDNKGASLRIMDNKKDVFLRQEASVYTKVGELTKLYVDKNDITTDANALSIKFSQPTDKAWSDLFHEGQTYQLYMPFGEYDANGDLLDNACEGYIVMDVKIVPEYLTWQGDADAVWYNDANWKQSTEKELYMGNKADTDANGSDPIENAFSPLYFSKITIPGDKTLNLSEESGLTGDIQYDMAVSDASGNISPYYINKVSEIYFKPEAKLVNQHYLDYGKAWVEFEIANNKKHWFASPLEDVYAGDFYAPKATGRQETEAFAEIKYEPNNMNSRWAPAFYQKAWNSAIKYATNADGTSSEQVEAVKSNWSIEYNNVTVKYPIGKGFYLSVEDVPNTNGTALVRLPKADAVTDYQYEEATKASVLRADETYSKANSGQLAAYKKQDGNVTVRLSDLFGESAQDVTGDAPTAKKRHFLVGNPYMTYLNMTKFFEGNDFLEGNKYWRLTDGTVSAVVGTPDVPFENGDANGTVKPMEAFFVELADGATVDDNTVITFTPAMMSATEIAQGGTTTKGATASNPVITITAERGEIKSVATLSTSDRADNGYKADEDAVVLLDSELDAPMVYTVAGSLAAQVNAVKSIDNIGLGLYNDSRDEVTITISGLSRMANQLYLYDANTGKSVKMDSDSYSMTIGGNSHGRYFLRDSELGSELDNAISIYSAQSGRVIVSAIRPVKDIKVFSLSGSQIRGFAVNSTQYSFDLPAGIYMIYAGDGEQEKTEKVIVR